jgi:hypothetical protein
VNATLRAGETNHQQKTNRDANATQNENTTRTH